MTSRGVPQNDPRAGYLAYRQELDDAWRRVMQGGRYVLGGEVSAFEQEFCEYLGTGDVVGTASGTDALYLALRAIGVDYGDRVLTVSHTAVATLAGIAMTRARPVFVDIDPVTFTMDPNALYDAIRRETNNNTICGKLKAVVVVHLYGHPADMPSILDVARHNDLGVVEDCAQCHGATLAGRKAGTWGDIAAFSFYPTKNLGAFGDGGAIAMTDKSLAARCRALREYGWNESRISQEPGINSRLDELQAALLRVKLRHLEQDNAAHRRIAGAYDRSFTSSLVVPPSSRPGVEHAYHQYVVRSARRDDLRAALEQSGIGTAIHYTPPAHKHPAFREFYDHERPLPQTDLATAEIISLPIYPQMPTEHANQVAETIGHWMSSGA